MLATVSRQLGLEVTLLIAEKAVHDIRQRYPEAAKIVVTDSEVTFGGLSLVDEATAAAIATEFGRAVVDTLSRLVGQRLAAQVLGELEHTTGGVALGTDLNGGGGPR